MQLKYTFEELALINPAPRIVAGLVDGECDVDFDPDGGFEIDAIRLKCSYLPKIGEKGRSETHELIKDGPYWNWVHSALLEFHEELIGEVVDQALAEEEERARARG